MIYSHNINEHSPPSKYKLHPNIPFDWIKSATWLLNGLGVAGKGTEVGIGGVVEEGERVVVVVGVVSWNGGGAETLRGGAEDLPGVGTGVDGGECSSDD